MSNIVCYYHKGDYDGICSAAIVKYKYPKAKLVGINNHNIELVHKPSDKVIIVDISLKEHMINIPYNSVWIDHHSQSIIESEQMGFNNLPGIRRNGTAACILTWEFFIDNEIPQIVQLLGDYDVWNIDKENVQEFQEGLKLIEDSYNPESNLWRFLFDYDWLSNIINNGRTAIKYRESLDKKLISDYGYKRTLWGYECLLINTPTVSNFLYYYTDADIVVTYRWGGHFWSVSLRTKKDIDVSVIAKKNGGGGHKSAAAFITQDIRQLL